MRVALSLLFLTLFSWSCSSATGSSGTGDGNAPAACQDFSGGNPCASTPGGSCVDGYCLVPSDVTCRVTNGADDGCGADSICRDGAEGPRCYKAPPCPTNDICPVPGGGTVGGGVTCNTGALAGKSSICIPNRCLADADCNKGSHCVLGQPSDVLGTCYDGVETMESDGDGSGWESGPGCEITSSVLVGKGAPGVACTDPTQCAPTCCACGQGAELAAKCTLDSTALAGTCASASDACAGILIGTSKGTCTVPAP